VCYSFITFISSGALNQEGFAADVRRSLKIADHLYRVARSTLHKPIIQIIGLLFVVIGTGQLKEVCSILQMGQLQYI
jgi:hypothetical protein